MRTQVNSDPTMIPKALWAQSPLVLLVAILMCPKSAWAFPINSPNARTLFGGFTLASPRVKITRATTLLQDGGPVSDPQEQDLTVVEEDVTVVYGATRDLTVGMSVPIVEKRLIFRRSSGGKATIAADGFGDLSLVGAYRFFREDVPLGTTQVSLLGGLKLPTGRSSQTDRDVPLLTGGTSERLPPSLQLGSGSVDGIIGLGAMKNINRLTFYGSIQAKINGSGAEGFRAGNTIFYDLSADYVFLESRNLFLILELNGIYAQKSEQRGASIADSGGNTLFISPGMQYLPLPYLVLEASIQIPIHQELNGRQLGTDFTVVTGFRYLF